MPFRRWPLMTSAGPFIRCLEHDPRIEQVWFAGCHANVGGGYEKQGLSLVALDG